MALRDFDPDLFLEKWDDQDCTPQHSGKTFEQCIRVAFGIPEDDQYVYRAQGETTLAITQKAIDGHRAHGLHNWYHDEELKPIPDPFPTTEEITAYTSLFSPEPSLSKALNACASTAKPGSLQSAISKHLSSLFLHLKDFPNPSTPALLPSRSTTRTHKNPYLALWASTCHTLEWAGPTLATVHTKQSHHILPVLYHHFGCIVPSYAALHVIAKLAQPAKPSKEGVRPILDIGSGTGYWTFMLRRFDLPGHGSARWKDLDVRAVDDGTSEYRVAWIRDTVRSDGVAYLDGMVDGGKGCVLLLVYPQATGGFTERAMRRFEGDSIVVAGTQNANGFTGFRGARVDEWVERELGSFELTLRMPLPSFAGKDEGLFVFQRKRG